MTIVSIHCARMREQQTTVTAAYCQFRGDMHFSEWIMSE